jgi:hypothetical protein
MTRPSQERAIPKGTPDPLAAHTDGVLWRAARHLPFLNQMVAKREQTLARSCCQQMLEIRSALKAQEPALDSEALYERAVSQRLACDMTRAREVVRMADVSFAQWPEERDVRFRDVVNYLIVHEILGKDPKAMGTQSNIDRIIRDSIPKEL